MWQDSKSTTYEDEDEDDQDLYYQDEEDTPLYVLQDMYRLFREESDDTMMNSVDFKMTFLLIM